MYCMSLLICMKVYHKYYWRVCYQVVFKGFNNLNLFALQQQPKGALTRGDTAGGVEPQETTSRDDASTGFNHIPDEESISVCMCTLCVGVQCHPWVYYLVSSIYHLCITMVCCVCGEGERSVCWVQIVFLSVALLQQLQIVDNVYRSLHCMLLH